jgi:hypothetical protein
VGGERGAQVSEAGSALKPEIVGRGATHGCSSSRILDLSMMHTIQSAPTSPAEWATSVSSARTDENNEARAQLGRMRTTRLELSSNGWEH